MAGLDVSVPCGNCPSGPPMAPLKGAAGQADGTERTEQGSWTASVPGPQPSIPDSGRGHRWALSWKLGATGSHDGEVSSHRWLRGGGDQEGCTCRTLSSAHHLPPVSQAPHPPRGTCGSGGSAAGEPGSPAQSSLSTKSTELAPSEASGPMPPGQARLG